MHSLETFSLPPWSWLLKVAIVEGQGRLFCFVFVSLQFICGLSLCCGTQAHLSRDEIQKVVDVYRQPDGRVRYKEFCDIMENG